MSWPGVVVVACLPLLAAAAPAPSGQQQPPSPAPPAAVNAAEGVRRPGSGVGGGLGYAYGGDRLLRVTFNDGTVQDLTAGTGYVLYFEAAVTPLWLAADRVGFGGGLQLAWKFDQISTTDGSVTLARFPVIAFGQIVVPTSPSRALLLRAGVLEEPGAAIWTENISPPEANTDLSSGVGFMAEVGVWVHLMDRGAATASLRYTSLSYSADGATRDARNLGFTIALLYML